jgi:clan AA aspartic protease (TIGR02281 family)
MKSYDFELKRRKLLVKATLKGTVRSQEVKLILDTGAGTTVISEDVIRFLGFDMSKVKEYESFVTAGGSIKAKVIKLHFLDCLGKRKTSFKVAVYDLPAQAIAYGVLGIDFLQLFDKVCIDFENLQVLV